MSNNSRNRFSPLWLALSAVVGIFVGTFYANHFSGNRLSIINSGSNKLNNLLYIIDDQYVDTVNMGDLVEHAMPTILAELDPHSVYISAKDVQTANDDLRGSFSASSSSSATTPCACRTSSPTDRPNRPACWPATRSCSSTTPSSPDPR